MRTAMGKRSTFFALGLSVTLMFLPLHSQTVNPPAANAAATAAAPVSQAPVTQAPDDMTAKITALVHARKYADAQQLTAGLLIAYPNDQRLIKAKVLLSQLLAPNVAPSTPNSNPSDPLATYANASQFAGMEQIEYNSLIEMAREAQQTTDLGQQKTLLQQFMDKSGPFLEKHPQEMLLWLLRGASAISLNDPLAGYEAGHNLLAAGGADSSDPNLQRLIAQLNLKGWLDKQQATLAAAKLHLTQPEAERVLTEAVITTAEDWRVSGFESESFSLTARTDSRTLRYDEVKTFDVKNQGGFCYVAIRGHMPRTFSTTRDWEPNLFFIAWAQSHCSDAHKFAEALSTLARAAAPKGLAFTQPR